MKTVSVDPKNYLQELVTEVKIGEALYKEYRDNNRKCQLLDPIYHNNKKMLGTVTTILNRPGRYNNDVIEEINILQKHLVAWTAAYDKKGGISERNGSCMVEYDDKKFPFPVNILKKLTAQPGIEFR